MHPSESGAVFRNHTTSRSKYLAGYGSCRQSWFGGKPVAGRGLPLERTCSNGLESVEVFLADVGEYPTENDLDCVQAGQKYGP